MVNGQIEVGLREQLRNCKHAKDCDSHEFLILYIDLTNTKLENINTTQTDTNTKLDKLLQFMEKLEIIEQHEEQNHEKQHKDKTYKFQTQQGQFSQFWTRINGITGICSIIVTCLVAIFTISNLI